MENKLRFEAVLLVNLEDQASRDFIGSLTGEQIASFKDIVNVYHPEHLERLYYYLEDLHLPWAVRDFPAVWVFIPKTHTYTDTDQVALLSGFKTYKEIVDESDWQMVQCIIEDRLMSESYKRAYILEQLMQSSVVPANLLAGFIACRTLKEIKLLYQRYALDGLLVGQDQEFILKVKNKTGEDLSEKLILTSPPQYAALPAKGSG